MFCRWHRTFIMDVDWAVCAALAIKSKIVIPMHFKKKGNPQECKDKVEDIFNVKAVLLEIGENYNVPE